LAGSPIIQFVALEGEPSTSDVAPGTKEHGVDLQARRKTYDDLDLSGLLIVAQVQGNQKWKSV
jgi:hypothetical protein